MAEVNPLEELVKEGVISQESMDEQMAAKAAAEGAGDPNPDIDPSDDPAPAPEGNPEPQKDGDPSGDPAPEVDPVQESFYKALGYEKDDDVVAALNELKDYRTKAADFQAQEASIKEKAAILAKFENPYSNPIVGKIDAAVKHFGIDDIGLVSRIVGMTGDAVAKDPIQAIVVAKIIAEPTLLQTEGISFDDLIAIEMSDRGDIDMEDKDSIAYKKLVIESKSALTKINTFQQSLSEEKGRYTFAHEEAQASAAKTEELRGKIAPKVEELMKAGTRKFEVEGHEVNISFAKDEIATIVSMATGYAVNQGIDINTTEGVKSLGEIVGMVAKGAAVQNFSYDKALIESAKAKAIAEYVKEQSLGKPSPRSSSAGEGRKVEQLKGQDLYDKMMREVGGM
jgi:hypothetical protein